jgi:hypothetical protein
VYKRQEYMDAMMQNQKFLSDQLNQLIQINSISAGPKEIVKDAEGRPIGIRPIINGENQ